MYHQIIGLLRCLLHFSLVQSAIMCIGALDLTWADLWVKSVMIPLTVQSNLQRWLLHLTIPTVLYSWFHVVSLFSVCLCVNCMHYSSTLKFHTKLYLYCVHIPTYCNWIAPFMQVRLQALSVFQACWNTWTQTETHYRESGPCATVWRAFSFKQVL